MNNIDNYRQLGMAVTLQSLKDFIEADPIEQKAIIADLRTPYMEFLSNGLSVPLADRLEKNPTEICNRIKKALEDEEARAFVCTDDSNFYADLRMEQLEQM